MKLREYKSEDGKVIAGWIRSEDELYKSVSSSVKGVPESISWFAETAARS